ncbi:hypothetical protein DPMN_078614 [Dreissena polymorpha]|uniref:Uncharacterized protein n=1 Tax=Dreissena polymorpha TaxID=45954 RepID=A0A9D4BQM8_DREPO|nr:hypothetical protein DPMN_078614 [Dreissena polymorpha]
MLSSAAEVLDREKIYKTSTVMTEIIDICDKKIELMHYKYTSLDLGQNGRKQRGKDDDTRVKGGVD